MGESKAKEQGFSIQGALQGRCVLLTGVTGFLGKVVLAMLLEHTNVRKVLVMVRSKSDLSASQRLAAIFNGPLFESIRDRLGPELFRQTIVERIAAITGDLTDDGCGLSESDWAVLRNQPIDVVVNSAGLVDFSPPVDEALSINVEGVLRLASLAKQLNAKFVHVSTCFVAGQRDSTFDESLPVLGYCPKSQRVFEPVTVYEGLKKEIVNVQHATNGPDISESPKQRQRALIKLGQKTAESWGWTNTYTFTKQLGEQLLVHHYGDRIHIVRPSIIESALRYPLVGWNEGFTTSAPLIMLAQKGLPIFPYAKDVVLDLVPVDHVAAVVLLATAKSLAVHSKQKVFHACTGSQHPLYMGRAIELTGLWSRNFHQRKRGRDLWSWWRRHHEMMGVSESGYKRLLPAVVDALKPVAPRVEEALKNTPMASVAQGLTQGVKGLQQLRRVLDMFLPFVARHKVVFDSTLSDHALRTLPEPERTLFQFDICTLGWAHYMHQVHIPGLQRWVFGELEKKFTHTDSASHAKPNADASTHHKSTPASSSRLLHKVSDVPALMHRWWGESENTATDALGSYSSESGQNHPTSERYAIIGEQSEPSSADLSETWRRLGRSAIRKTQQFLYKNWLQVEVEGQSSIPKQGGFLVVANHSSHLDAGLVKHALGPAGRHLVMLAAKDYFFQRRAMQWALHNFTNVMPLDRMDICWKDLKKIIALLESGRRVLMFPEGTRSRSGDVQPFHSAATFVASKARVPILPMGLHGTFEAMPKGYHGPPKPKRLKVRIGEEISHQHLMHWIDKPGSGRYQHATTQLRHRVAELL